MELPINVHSFTFCSKLHCHNINHFLFSYLSTLGYTKIALRKAHIPNIHALNIDTHTLRIQSEYTQKQGGSVTIEGMHIWYIALISLYHDIYLTELNKSHDGIPSVWMMQPTKIWSFILDWIGFYRSNSTGYLSAGLIWFMTNTPEWLSLNKSCCRLRQLKLCQKETY